MKFDRAREILEEELDLITVLRKLRFYGFALSGLLMPQRVDFYKKSCQKLNIDSTDSGKEQEDLSKDARQLQSLANASSDAGL